MPACRSAIAGMFCALAPLVVSAQTRPTLLADSSRLRGAEWTVVPLVQLDSSRTADTTAFRQIRGVFPLAPGRLLFEGRLTRSGKWGLYSVEGGAVRRVSQFGVEFTEPDGEKKKALGILESAGGRLAVMASIRSRLPNAHLLTDGTSWRRMISTNDTLKLGDAPVVLSGLSLVKLENDGSLLLRVTLRTPKGEGIVRLRDGRLERVLMTGDTLPGIGVVDASYAVRGMFGSVAVGMKQFTPTSQGWVAVFRHGLGSGTWRDHVVIRQGSDPPRLRFTTDPWSKPYEGLGDVTLLPGGELVAQRGESVGVIDTAGAWKQLLTAAEARLPKNQVFFLTQATPVDATSNRALLSIAFSRSDVSSSTHGVTFSTSWSVWPRLFHYDGAKATEVAADSGLVMTGVYINIRPEPVVRALPGYDRDLIASHSFAMGRRASALYFDEEHKRLVEAPAFRTASGNIGVEALLAWNSDNEAIVRWNGLALLRRQAPAP